MQFVWMFFTGIAAGILSGMFGIGGGILIVPALVIIAGMTQQAATATSLIALLLPVGILGVMEYYRMGRISAENIWFGLLIALGLFAGAFFGAKIAIGLTNEVLRKAFAVFIGIVAVRMWLQ
ncbi:permease [Prosthecochloris sp. GSB1]|nr:permease [Prosthecochloris sp. GSB1]